MSVYPENPFALLQLPTHCTKQAVIDKGEELLHDAHHDPEQQAAIRQAVQQIITHPDERALYAFLEMPDTDYEPYDQEWERFARRFKHNPITLEMIRPMAQTFIEAHLYPAELLTLLAPLLRVKRPSPPQVLIPDTPSTEADLPLRANELF